MSNYVIFYIIQSGSGYYLGIENNSAPAMTSDPMFARRYYDFEAAEEIANLLKCIGFSAEIIKGRKGLM